MGAVNPKIVEMVGESAQAVGRVDQAAMATIEAVLTLDDITRFTVPETIRLGAPLL